MQTTAQVAQQAVTWQGYVYPLIFTVMGLLLTTALAVIGYFIKQKIENQDIDIEKNRESLANFKVKVANEYVHKDDFIRAIASLDSKMDNMGNQMKVINDNVMTLIGGEKNGK